MLRMALCAVAVVGFCVAGARADDTKKIDNRNQKKTEATITKVDSKAGTVTVKMKGDNGKDMTRTFHLTGDVVYFDSTGKVAALDLFRSGDYVLVVEGEGKVKEIHKTDHNKGAATATTPSKPDTAKKPGSP